MFGLVINVFLVLWLAVLCGPCLGQAVDSAATHTDQASAVDADPSVVIRTAIRSYVDAFNARDVDTMIALWSPEGVYTSRRDGDLLTGHEQLREEFTANFDQEQVPKLDVNTESIEFVSPNVAVERGTAKVMHSDDDVTETEYSVVYVKRDGKWLIDRVTEDEILKPTSNYTHLKDLEWFVGEWMDEVDGASVELDCQWTKNQNHIGCRFKITRGDEVPFSGLQIIGWDPQQKVIRSWLFDSDGGFVSGVWTKHDDHWTIQSVATLADGGSGSYTGVIRPIDDESFSWQKVNQVIDGQILPNMDEVIVRRKK